MPIRQDTLRERWLAQQRYAETTQAGYRDTLARFQRRFPCSVEHVTPGMLVDFLTTDENAEPARRAPNTLRRQRAALRSFWGWAHRNNYVRADPTKGLGELKLGTGEARPGRWLTHADALRLLDAARSGPYDSDVGERDYALIAVALLTGLRRAELASLRWRDVDLAQRRLSVRGKGGKYATVGLPDQAATALSRWLRTAIAAQGRKPRLDDPVFPTGLSRGGLGGTERVYTFDWSTAVRPWTIRDIIRRHADDAGLGVVATHDLRRSFAGFLDEKGTDLQSIQAALRHATPSVTARCYLDRSPRRAIQAVTDLRLVAERRTSAAK